MITTAHIGPENTIFNPCNFSITPLGLSKLPEWFGVSASILAQKKKIIIPSQKLFIGLAKVDFDFKAASLLDYFSKNGYVSPATSYLPGFLTDPLARQTVKMFARFIVLDTQNPLMFPDGTQGYLCFNDGKIDYLKSNAMISHKYCVLYAQKAQEQSIH